MGMFYLGAILVIAGLILLLYTVVAVSFERKPVLEPPPPAPPQTERFSERRRSGVETAQEREAGPVPIRRTAAAPRVSPPSTVATREAQKEQLIVEGAFYEDYGHRIQQLVEEQKSYGEIPAEWFDGFKRVGPAQLKICGEEFLIHSRRRTTVFSPEMLDQVVFHEKGVIFLMNDPALPSGVFLTDTPDAIQSFIQKNSKKLD